MKRLATGHYAPCDRDDPEMIAVIPFNVCVGLDGRLCAPDEPEETEGMKITIKKKPVEMPLVWDLQPGTVFEWGGANAKYLKVQLPYDKSKREHAILIESSTLVQFSSDQWADRIISGMDAPKPKTVRFDYLEVRRLYRIHDNIYLKTSATNGIRLQDMANVAPYADIQVEPINHDDVELVITE